MNHMALFQELAGTTVNKLGKDQTGTISYSINHAGFRSSYEYDFVPDYAFFGCSAVLGIGVSEGDRLSSYFNNVHNYGIATDYNNTDIYKTLTGFVESENYSPNTVLVVIWSDKDDNSSIPEFSNYLNALPNKVLNIKFGLVKIDDTLSVPSNVDYDVSGTHAGPKTHKLWSYFLQKHLNTQ